MRAECCVASAALIISDTVLSNNIDSTSNFSLSCREDISSADQAIEAVATLLHEVAPDGDVGAAADALRQV